MIGVLSSGWGAVQATRHGPRDWRLILIWISWALGAAIAIGTIAKEADERQIEQ
jgi:hypothetical protein